jgi:hypothetical protein
MEQAICNILLPFAFAKKKTLSNMPARLKGPFTEQSLALLPLLR